jgi:glycerate dehydrogenase
MKQKIVVLDGYALNPGDLSWEPLEELGELTVYEHTESNQIVDRISDATIILTNKTPINSDTISCCDRLTYIGVMATGYDVVDIDAAHRKNIIVSNVPAYSTYSVAQMTFALLLEICHHVGHHNRAVHKGRWVKNRDFCFWDYPGIELQGKTLGIVGFGRIGSKVADVALAFGMKVLGYSRNPDKSMETDTLAFVSLEELYRNSDIISFHVPANKETSGMVNKQTISMMKDSVILLNTARGSLFNENDVYSMLVSKKIQAVGIDVLSKEPPHTSNPLLEAPNCFITPHIAWGTTEARLRCMEITYNNVLSFLHDKPINII